MGTKTLLCVMVISGIFAISGTAFTQSEKNYYRENHGWDNDGYVRDLQGRWYMNGDRNKPTQISIDHGRLEATNENGQRSRLEVGRFGNVRAYDWHDLRGDVRRDRIEWNNGTTWTRRPSERISSRYDRFDRGKDDTNRLTRQLQGRWYMNGDRDKPTQINTDNGRLEARNESGQTSRLEVDRYGNVRAPDWQGLRGDVRGNRIEWNNGTTWTRSPTKR